MLESLKTRSHYKMYQSRYYAFTQRGDNPNPTIGYKIMYSWLSYCYKYYVNWTVPSSLKEELMEMRASFIRIAWVEGNFKTVLKELFSIVDSYVQKKVIEKQKLNNV